MTNTAAVDSVPSQEDKRVIYACARACVATTILGELVAEVFRSRPDTDFDTFRAKFHELGSESTLAEDARAADPDGAIHAAARIAVCQIFGEAEKALAGEARPIAENAESSSQGG